MAVVAKTTVAAVRTGTGTSPVPAELNTARRECQLMFQAAMTHLEKRDSSGVA